MSENYLSGDAANGGNQGEYEEELDQVVDEEAGPAIEITADKPARFHPSRLR